MNKIKKFKKSKKTNNKRNHKRRRMTRKLMGGVIKPDWPLDKETPPQPLNGTSQPIVVSDKPMVVQPVVVSEKPEPSDKNLQSLEDRIRLLEENIRGFNFTPLEQEIQRFEERINEIQQTDNTGELREQITALQRKIELLKSEDSELFIPLGFFPNMTTFNSDHKLGILDTKLAFFNKNITTLYIDSMGSDYSYVTIANQLLKFKHLKRIFPHSLLAGNSAIMFDDKLNAGIMETFISRPNIDRIDNRKPHCRLVINFFKKLNREIKYIYRGKNNGPETEYDLAGLEDILIQEGLLD